MFSRKNSASRIASRTRLIVLFAFVTSLFLLGGGSRSDIVSLIILRPLAVIASFYALAVAMRERRPIMTPPMVFLLALITWMLLQIVPLPPQLWERLPGRSIVVEIQDVLGVEGVWRPLTLSPAMTLNALTAMVVPIAAILLLQIQLSTDRHLVWHAVVLAALGSILLGGAQILDGASSPLYLYRVTNDGSMVGLFANRNHHAVFIAATLPAFTILLQRFGGKWGPAARVMVSLGAGAVIGAACLVAGSRAGLSIYTISFVVSVWLMREDFAMIGRKTFSRANLHDTRFSKYIGFLFPLLIIAAIIAGGLVYGEGEALNRIHGENMDEDARFVLLPVFIEMLTTYFPVGSGFGTFEFVFKIAEPESFLHPQYMNHAHNDFVQFLLEGGIPAAIIAIVFLAWFGKTAWRLARGEAGHGLATASAAMIVLLMLASLVDYPLRVPSLMAVFAFACSYLHLASLGGERTEN